MIIIDIPNRAASPMCIVAISGLDATAYIINNPSISIKNPINLTRFLLLGSTSLNFPPPCVTLYI